MKPGTLYLIGTPIGNLADVTFRAVEVLKTVSLIAAEDTRRTRQLCQKYAIPTPLTSLHEHNEKTKAGSLIEKLLSGESVALVSDAGMPVVSDPGAVFVKKAHEEQISIAVIPGPSAATSALALSGFWGERFRFEGFPPKKKSAMVRWLEELKEETSPVICFESPYRLVKLLQGIQEVLGEIPVVVCRELTKLHEEAVRGSTEELIKRYTTRTPKGECTVVFLPKDKTQ